MYLAIMVSFDCVDTKMRDRREVQYQCKKISATNIKLIITKFMCVCVCVCVCVVNYAWTIFIVVCIHMSSVSRTHAQFASNH